MKNSRDFREHARHALRGKWRVAVLTGFIAALLGALIFGGNAIDINFKINNASITVMDVPVTGLEAPVQTLLIICIVGLGLLQFVMGGAVRLGYSLFNLNLVDGRQAACSDLFSQMHRFGTGFAMNFLTELYIALWSLLLVVPGIIKAYSYAMTPYILAENPGMTANEAITQSQQIMDGNKWRLFCLQLSFIGWQFLSMAPAIISVFVMVERVAEVGKTLSSSALPLCLALGIIPCFIASLFLIPYKEAAQAAFYRDIAAQTE